MGWSRDPDSVSEIRKWYCPRCCLFVDHNRSCHLCGKHPRGASVPHIPAPAGHPVAVDDALHHLRSNLTKVLGYLQLLDQEKMGELNYHQKVCTRGALSGAGAILDLIDRLPIGSQAEVPGGADSYEPASQQVE